MTLTIVPARPAHRQLVGRLAHGQGAADVQPLHRPPALGGDPLGGHEVLAAGVVEQQVEPAVPLERRRDDRSRARRLADVAGHPRAALAELGRGLLQDLRAAPGDHHRGAAARQLGGRRLAEIGAAAGDQRDLAVERAVGEDRRRRQRLLPHHLDHEPLRSPAVELAVEDLLPGPEIEPPSVTGTIT